MDTTKMGIAIVTEEMDDENTIDVELVGSLLPWICCDCVPYFLNQAQMPTFASKLKALKIHTGDGHADTVQGILVDAARELAMKRADGANTPAVNNAGFAVAMAISFWNMLTVLDNQDKIKAQLLPKVREMIRDQAGITDIPKNTTWN